MTKWYYTTTKKKLGNCESHKHVLYDKKMATSVSLQKKVL